MSGPVTKDEFEACVSESRAQLHAYCYRMLGSVQDADDALQEALIGAWRGLAGFEGRSALRSWLYRIATNACLRVIAQRPKRLLAADHGPPTEGVELARMVQEPIWLEPYPEDAETRLERVESLELAFVAALQHLPATQRAALILCEVLELAAAEVAQLLDMTVPAVNSALQRARANMAQRLPGKTQQTTLRELGEQRQRELVASYVDAWERSDVAALVALLAEDVRFSMPPIPSWFLGRDAVVRFFAERVFATPWRLVPMRASGQLAFACYQGPGFALGALNVVTLRDRSICELTGFLDPALYARFRLPER
jgi:RNA polymerase sigma-70 factor (TIGR02960 family)